MTKINKNDKHTTVISAGLSALRDIIDDNA